MMRIGQHSPPALDKGTQTREATSPVTQKAPPAAPPPSAPPSTGAGLPPVQSHFGAPVRPNTSAQGRNFVTPPPPGKAKSGAKVSSEQLKQAATSAFTMVHGREPTADELKTLEDKGRKMADEGKDFDGVKYGLHAQLTAEKTGEPVPTSSSSSSAGSSAATNYIQQSVYGAAMGMPSGMGTSAAMLGASSAKPSGPPPQASASSVQLTPAQMKQAITSAFTMVHGRAPSPSEFKKLEGQAQQLVKEGKNFDGVKYGLHAQLTAAKTGEAAPGADTKLSPAQLKEAVTSAFTMVHGRAPSPSEFQKLEGQAQQLVKEGKNFDGVKYGLHAQLTAEKTGEPVSTSSSSSSAGSSAVAHAIQQSVYGAAMGMPATGASAALFGKAASIKPTDSAQAAAQAPLRQAVDDMHQLVFGMKASGSGAQELMTHAQGLGATHGNDLGAIRHALHSLLTGKSAPSAGGAPASLSKDRLTQAMNEAHQLVFGANPSAAKALHLMGRTLELAGQLQHDFHALKFALHSQLSGKPMPAPGGAHPTPTDTQLRQTLDEAHQVAFKQAAGGPHLNAWMNEARQLAAHHGNDLQAVKLALHSQMLEAK